MLNSSAALDVDKLDDAIIENLHGSIDSLFIWFLFATFAVIVGVALEALEHFSIPTKMDPNTGVPATDWRLSQLRHRAIKLGSSLVVLGVTGELVSEYIASEYEGKLRTFNKILVESSRSQTALANERTAKLTRDNLALQAEVLKLQLRQNWRILSDAQSKKLASMWRPFRVRHWSITPQDQNEIEQEGLVNRLTSCFFSAGWGIPGRESPEFWKDHPGIVVVISPRADRRTIGAAEAIVKGLQEVAHFEAVLEREAPKDAVYDQHIRIRIFHR